MRETRPVSNLPEECDASGLPSRRTSPFVAFLPTALSLLVACSKAPPPTAEDTASPSSSVSAAAPAPSTSALAAASDGTDPKSPSLAPDDAAFTDARKGWGWGDRCVAELRAGKFGWARAACDRGLALPDLDPKARPPLLYNEGLIAKATGDLAAARTDFAQSLALRAPNDPGLAEVTKELKSVGGSVTPAEATAGDAPLECRAKDGGATVELFLAWEKNVAKGLLRTTADGGSLASRAVQAEMYKGLVLVNPAGMPDASQRIATEQTEGGKKIQVGDWKQPWLDCETRAGAP
jgi:hypothetical protein